MKPRTFHPRSTSIVLLAGGLAAIGMTRPSQGQEKLPTAEQVIEKFIQATGGRPAYEKLHNQVTRGTVEFLQAGIKGKITTYKAEPNKEYKIIEIEGVGTMEEGADGRVAWEISSEQGARVKTGDEKAATLRDSSFKAILHWHELFSKAECVAEENIAHQPCYKVVLTPAAGKPVVQYYDEKSGLLVKVIKNVMTATLGEVSAEAYLGDYRSIGGILLPYELRNVVLSQEVHVHVESVQFDVEIPQDRFDLPPAVSALLKIKS